MLVWLPFSGLCLTQNSSSWQWLFVFIWTIILPVVLCGYEYLSCTLREEHTLALCENMVWRRMFEHERGSNRKLNLQSTQRAGNFLIHWATNDLSKEVLLHGIVTKLSSTQQLSYSYFLWFTTWPTIWASEVKATLTPLHIGS
jgi:hypothetical protein